MGKEKKEKKVLDESHTNGDTSVVEEISYEDRLKFVSVIAHPMASKKLAKKVSLCFDLALLFRLQVYIFS